MEESWGLIDYLQFANAFFDTETKVKIAKALDSFGVEYIELTSPASSEQSRRDCEIICKLGLKVRSRTLPFSQRYGWKTPLLMLFRRPKSSHTSDATWMMQGLPLKQEVWNTPTLLSLWNLTYTVDGLDIVIGTSPQLMQHSHGKSKGHLPLSASMLTFCRHGLYTCN